MVFEDLQEGNLWMDGMARLLDILFRDESDKRIG